MTIISAHIFKAKLDFKRSRGERVFQQPANATVTATNAATGILVQPQPVSDGLFNITGLLPGIYNVQAAANGLEKVTKQGETLITATTLTVNFEWAWPRRRKGPR